MNGMRFGFSRRIVHLLAIVALASVASSALVGCASSKARAERVQHGQWADCYRLTNGTVDLVVVPSIGGRIMRYGFVGGPNQLWEAPPNLPPDAGWMNHGGDKVWIWPQERWQARLGKAWPPPEALDGSPHVVEVVDASTLRVTSPRFGAHGLQIVREIRLAPKGTRVDFDIRLSSEKPTARERWAVWTVTQVPAAEKLKAQMSPEGRERKRWAFEYGNGNVRPDGDAWVEIEIPPREKAKLMIDANAVSAKRGDVEFVQEFRGSAPTDADAPMDRLQIFSNQVTDEGVPAAYQELEFTSPQVAITPDQPARLRLSWELRKAEQKPAR